MIITLTAAVATVSGMLMAFESLRKYSHMLSSLLLLIFFYLLVGGNSDNADYLTYVWTYQGSSDFTWDRFGYWAYYLTIAFCRNLGLDFVSYRLIMYGIGFLFLFLFMRKIIGWSPLFLFFYFIFPMGIDATQMKNFVAMTILAYAFTFLCSSSKKGNIFYYLLVLLASGFHVAFLIFLPVPFFRRALSIRYFSVIFWTIVLSMIVLLSTGPGNTAFMTFLGTITPDDLMDKQALYLNQSVRFGYIIFLIANILIAVGLRYVWKVASQSLTATITEKNFIHLAYICSLYSFLFFPFYMFTLEFARFFRDLFPIFHAAIVIALNVMCPKYLTITVRQILLLGCYLILLFYMGIFVIYNVFDSTVIPLFQSNIFI